MKLWQSLGRGDQPKTNNRQKTETWVCLEINSKRSKERKKKKPKKRNKAKVALEWEPRRHLCYCSSLKENTKPEPAILPPFVQTQNNFSDLNKFIRQRDQIKGATKTLFSMWKLDTDYMIFINRRSPVKPSKPVNPL